MICPGKVGYYLSRYSVDDELSVCECLLDMFEDTAPHRNFFCTCVAFEQFINCIRIGFFNCVLLLE